MLSKENLKIDSTSLINVIFALFPLTFIFGNLITNINLVLFCCLGLFYLKSKYHEVKFNNSLKIILFLFIIIFVSSGISFIKIFYIHGFDYNSFFQFFKSITFFRFYLMLAIAYFLTNFGILNFKYFFLSAAVLPLFVSLDVIFQYIFGFNIIGLKSIVGDYHNSSFFGDELISGGYIQNFCFFSIPFFVLMFKNQNNFKFVYIVLLTSIIGTGILLSGNRMSLILFFLGLFLFFLITNDLKKIILASFLSLIVIFGFIGSYDKQVGTIYESYYGKTKYLLKNFLPGNQSEIKSKSKHNKENLLDTDFESLWAVSGVSEKNAHLKLFLTALDTWKENKIFGNGIKSFRKDCKKFKDFKENRMCSNHPHNYYLEILTETGVIGFIITITLGLMFIFFVFKNLNFLKGKNMENFILLAAIISLILEVFPLKSSGSIFTTNNTTYLILLSSIILSHKKAGN